MRQHLLSLPVQDLTLAVISNPEKHLGSESASRLMSYLGGYDEGRSEVLPVMPCVRMRESFHRHLCRIALNLDYDDSGIVPSAPPLTFQDLLVTGGFYCLDLESPRALRELASSDKIKELVSSRRSRDLGFYSLSSILSLVCEDETAAYRYYLSAWNSWVESATISRSPVAVETTNDVPANAKGVIPILKGMRSSLACDTLPKLRCFLDGYLFAYNECGKQPNRPFPFEDFAAWLARVIVKTPLPTDYRWDRLVLFKSCNVVHAINMLSTYVESFCADFGIDYS